MIFLRSDIIDLDRKVQLICVGTLKINPAIWQHFVVGNIFTPRKVSFVEDFEGIIDLLAYSGVGLLYIGDHGVEGGAVCLAEDHS